ncbi:MAG: hypothetical protein RI911_921 [Candidatus Parcubacteria bacterium]|jgi:hypothetical protein
MGQDSGAAKLRADIRGSHPIEGSAMRERFAIAGRLLESEGWAREGFMLVHDELQKEEPPRDVTVFDAFVQKRDELLEVVDRRAREWCFVMDNAIKNALAEKKELTQAQRNYIRYQQLQADNWKPGDLEAPHSPGSQMIAYGFKTGIKVMWYAALVIPILFEQRKGTHMTLEEYKKSLLVSREFLYQRALSSAESNGRLFFEHMHDLGSTKIEHAATYGIDAVKLHPKTLALSARGLSSDEVELMLMSQEQNVGHATETYGCPALHVAVQTDTFNYPNLIAGIFDEVMEYALRTVGSKLDEFTEGALEPVERTS